MDTIGEIMQDNIKDEFDNHLQELNRLALLIEPQKPRIHELLQELGGLVD